MMTECCTGLGMFFGMTAMLTPFIAIGAAIYLIVVPRRETNRIEAR